MVRARWRTAGAAIGGALLVVGLVACRADAGDPLATWVAKADPICRGAQQDADASRPVLFQPSMADTLQKSSSLSKDESQQLRALELPGERRAEVRDYLGSLDDRNRELDLLASEAAHPGPDFAPPSLDTLAADTQKAADQAQSLGLKECRAGIDLAIGASSTTTTTADLGAPGGPAGPLDPNAQPAPNPTDLDNQTQDQAG
jgi:hypothetical protein